MRQLYVLILIIGSLSIVSGCIGRTSTIPTPEADTLSLPTPLRATPTLISATPAPQTAAETSRTFDCSSILALSPSDCEALVNFYTATAGSAWRLPLDATAWLSTTAPCDWFGVTCANERVVALILPNAGLQNQLPATIGTLSALKTLDLRVNDLAGTLPFELSQLATLEALTLYHNDFSGELLPEFGRMQNLITVDLSNNDFNGSIPKTLGQLQKLEALNLNYNKLTGEIPAELANAQRLNWIELSYNRLTGAIPTSLVSDIFLGVDGMDLLYPTSSEEG